MLDFQNDMKNKPILLSEIFPFIKKIFCSEKKIIITIALFSFLVVLLVFCIFSEKQKNKDRIFLARESMLNSEITKLENHNDILEAEILLLRNEVKNLSHQKEQEKIAKISKYLADTEVSGEGIKIILNDNKNNSYIQKEELSIIHNTDLLKIVNFLWASGAKAISINDERLVQNSAISCIGPTILINKKRINSPFKIVAIGKKLNVDLVNNSSIMLLLNYRGIETKVTKHSKIAVPQGKYSTNR